MIRRSHSYALLMTGAAMGCLTGSAHAQTAPSETNAGPAAREQSDPVASSDGDIIVTARRREETSISAPVAITAVSGAQLQVRGIATVDALSRVVPTLITSEATSSPQGGIVAIRGLSGVDANPFSDQAVSFNIDGVPVARSSVRRLGQIDIAQVEVLKGPQALFFGKNSPGGIISVRTADPTKNFQTGLITGYEFGADETRTEGYVSGPITSTLGVRLAGYYDSMKGYVRNIAPASGTGVSVPIDRRLPNGDEYAVRGTLRWEPSDRFNARFKLSYNRSKGSGSTDNLQFVSCPLGQPQGTPAAFNGIENCRADNRVTSTDNIGPNFQNADSRLGNQTYLRSSQILSGLELNYDLTDNLKLSSISGFYRAENAYVGNFTANYAESGAPPLTFLPAYAGLKIREITQEVRLTSDFDGPVNFMVGGLYQDSQADLDAAVYRNFNTPIFSANYLYRQKGISYSIFGQATVKLLPKLELSGGARASFENKKLPIFRSAVAASPSTLVEVEAPREVSFSNLSPEATLSYRPSSRLTVYGSYKEGFLSGGFNATQPTISATLNANGRYPSLVNPTYDQQLISGFEGGIKASLLDGALRTNLSAYTYNTTGLQVAVLVGLVQELRNAGAVRTKGIEFDFSYRTPLPGLNIYGAASYEDGRYSDYQGTCYRGLAAPQCQTQVNRFTGVSGLLQDLSGTQLVRAPDWTGNIGFDYLTRDLGGFKFGLLGNFTFSDSFFTDVVSSPGGRQPAYQLFDAGVRVLDAGDRFELALLGRNLGNRFYFTRAADNPFSGSAPGGTGTLRGDTVAVPSRGREVWLRATFHFGR